jgi:hypothetical protein
MKNEIRENGLCSCRAEYKHYHPDVPRSDPRGFLGTTIELCHNKAKYIVVDDDGIERHVCGMHVKRFERFGCKITKIDKMTDKPKRTRVPCRCSELCQTWNSVDQDCEIYGWNHPAPSKCYYYQKYLDDEYKIKEEKER